MSGPRIPRPVPPELAIRRRNERLVGAISAPFTRISRRTLAGFGGAAGGALVATALLRSPLLGALAGVAIAALALALAWAPFRDPDLRAATELVSDHDRHERAEWRAETGSRIPIGVAAMEHWLATHPAGEGRASVLLRLGRLAEADPAIDAIEPKTPEEAFGVEILRLTRTLFTGQRPDLAPLTASWRSLPDPRERRHRRECLALLEAQVAVADRRDPVPVLAAARREIGEVHPSMLLVRILARWLVPGAIAIAIALGTTITI